MFRKFAIAGGAAAVLSGTAALLLNRKKTYVRKVFYY